MQEFADDNFNFDENGKKVIQKGRKRCGKRRNCSLRAISPFPIVFPKRLVLQTRKNQGLLGKGLTGIFTTVFYMTRACPIDKRSHKEFSVESLQNQTHWRGSNLRHCTLDSSKLKIL